jgi:hypothetical protein
MSSLSSAVRIDPFHITSPIAAFDTDAGDDTPSGLSADSSVLVSLFSRVSAWWRELSAQSELMARPQVELALQSAWLQEYSNSKFDSQPLMRPLLPKWFTRVYSHIGVLFCFLFHLIDQPRSWFMFAFLFVSMLGWLLSILPWVQLAIMRPLSRNAEWRYLSVMNVVYLGLVVYWSSDRTFIIRWMSRLHLSENDHDHLSSSDFILLVSVSLLQNLFWILAIWVAVCADAIVSPYRFWKLSHMISLLFVNSATLTIIFGFQANVLNFAPTICVWQLCDNVISLASQLALIRSIFNLKYLISLLRSPGALVILRAPIVHQVRAST